MRDLLQCQEPAWVAECRSNCSLLTCRAGVCLSPLLSIVTVNSDGCSRCPCIPDIEGLTSSCHRTALTCAYQLCRPSPHSACCKPPLQAWLQGDVSLLCGAYQLGSAAHGSHIPGLGCCVHAVLCAVRPVNCHSKVGAEQAGDISCKPMRCSFMLHRATRAPVTRLHASMLRATTSKEGAVRLYT